MNGTSPYASMGAQRPRAAAQTSGTDCTQPDYGQRPPRPTPFVSLAGDNSKDSCTTEGTLSMRSSSFRGVEGMASSSGSHVHPLDGSRARTASAASGAGSSRKSRTKKIEAAPSPGKTTGARTAGEPTRSAASSLESSPTPASLTLSHSFLGQSSSHARTPRGGTSDGDAAAAGGGKRKTTRQAIPQSAWSPPPPSSLQRGAAQSKSAASSAYPLRGGNGTGSSTAQPLRGAETTLNVTASSSRIPSPTTPPRRFMTIYTKSPSPNHAQSQPHPRWSAEASPTGSPARQTSTKHSSTYARSTLNGGHSPVSSSSSPSVGRPSHTHSHEVRPPKNRASTGTADTSTASVPSSSTTASHRSATTMTSQSALPSTKGGTFLEQWRARQQRQLEAQQHTSHSTETRGEPKAASRAPQTRGATPTKRSVTTILSTQLAPAATVTLPTSSSNRAKAAQREPAGASISSSPFQRVPTPEQAPTRAHVDESEDDLADSSITSTSSTILRVAHVAGTSTRAAPSHPAAAQTSARRYSRESPIDHRLSEELLPDAVLTAKRPTLIGENTVLLPPAASPLAPPLSAWHKTTTHRGSTESTSSPTASTLTPQETSTGRNGSITATAPSKAQTMDLAKSTGSTRTSLRPSQRQRSQASVHSTPPLSTSPHTTPYLAELEDYIQQQHEKLRHKADRTRTSQVDLASSEVKPPSSPSDTPSLVAPAPTPSTRSAAAALVASSGVDVSTIGRRSDAASTRTPLGRNEPTSTRTTSAATIPPPARAPTTASDKPLATTSAMDSATFARQNSGSRPLRDVLSRREERLQRKASSTVEVEASGRTGCSGLQTRTASLTVSPRPAAGAEKPPGTMKSTSATTTPPLLGTTAVTGASFERQLSVLELYRRRQSMGVKPVLSPSHLDVTSPPPLHTTASPTKPTLSQPHSRKVSMLSIGSDSSTFASSLSTAATTGTTHPAGIGTTPAATSSASTAALFDRQLLRADKPPAVPIDNEAKSALLRAAAAILEQTKPSGRTAPPLYTEVPGFDEEDEEDTDSFFDDTDEDVEMHSACSADSSTNDDRATDEAQDYSLSTTSSTPVPAAVPKLNFARLPSAHTSVSSQPPVAAAVPAFKLRTTMSTTAAVAAGGHARLPARTHQAKEPVSSTSSTPPVAFTHTATPSTVPTASTATAAATAQRTNMTSPAMTATSPVSGGLLSSPIDALEETVDAMLKQYAKRATVSHLHSPHPTAASTSPETKYETMNLPDASMPTVLSVGGVGSVTDTPVSHTHSLGAAASTHSTLTALAATSSSATAPSATVPTASGAPGSAVTASSILQRPSKELQEKVDALFSKSGPSAVSAAAAGAPPSRLVKVDPVSLAALKSKAATNAKATGAARLADINRRLAGNNSAKPPSDSDDDEDAPVDPLAEWCAPDVHDPHTHFHFTPTFVPEFVPPLDFSELFLENERDAFDKYRVPLPSAVPDPLRNYATLLERIGPLLPTPPGTPLVPPLEALHDAAASQEGDENACTPCGGASTTTAATAERRSSQGRHPSVSTSSPFLGHSNNGAGLEDVQFVPVVSHESGTERLVRAAHEMSNRESGQADKVERSADDGQRDAVDAAAITGNKAAAATSAPGARVGVNRGLQLTDESDALDGGRGREREEKMREHKRSVDRLLFSYQEQRARKVVVAEESGAFAELSEAFKGMPSAAATR